MATETLRIITQRGGNHHALSSRQFIIDHLAIVGEDYGANIHRAYKTELRRLAETNPGRMVRGKRGGMMVHYYREPKYLSFQMVVNGLAREGVIEFTGREEVSDKPMFANMEWKPVRRYYRLKS